MESQKQLTIGLFGFGVVGEGLYRVLQQTPSLKAKIKKVCIKDASKKRNAPDELFTTDKDVLLNDPEINVIVEVINESEPAFEIVSRALRSGKEVVVRNKKCWQNTIRSYCNYRKKPACLYCMKHLPALQFL